MPSSILAIAGYLPETVVTNEDLANLHPEWSVQRIAEKTGIVKRHVANAGQRASDLAFEAAQRLFASGTCTPGEIDYLLFCTQSPDFLLPTTACLLQHRLGIPTNAGALDFNLGCSGYIYGLGLAQGLLASGQAKKLLLLTAETYSKYLDPDDRSCVTIFGDGAAATLLESTGDATELKPVFVYGTDGAGGPHLIVRGGANRQRAPAPDDEPSLWMDGPEIFHFTLQAVPACLNKLLAKSRRKIEDIDLFVFHQANRYMLEHLRRKLEIPEEKFHVFMADCGNTVSSTIPLALEDALRKRRIKDGDQVVLVGFGVGLSWGATVLTWPFLGVQA